jgi:DNA polymerase V
VKAAKEVLKGIYHQGYLYKRAGVIVLGITPNNPLQQDLFDLDAEHIQKFRQLDKVVDRINKRYGTETIVIGAQQYTRPNGEGKANIFARSTFGRLLPTGRKNAIKHDFKSKNTTTRWSDIIKLK